MDWTLYWFMLPVAILVATSAMMSGIGGATLFMPIYVLIFPLLGPEGFVTLAERAVLSKRAPKAGTHLPLSPHLLGWRP